MTFLVRSPSRVVHYFYTLLLCLAEISVVANAQLGRAWTALAAFTCFLCFAVSAILARPWTRWTEKEPQ